MPDIAIERKDLAEQILDVIASEGKVERSRITPEATLQSLEVESMDVVMILMVIEEKFGVYVPIDGAIAESSNVASFVNAVADRILESRG
ncbi:MAG TPA: acyl carrier protein [Stellaceae bacterium]|nr:acyl carrier protein [Stellaceae bacterium]